MAIKQNSAGNPRKKYLPLTPRHSLAWKTKNDGRWHGMFTASSLAKRAGTTVRTIQYYDRIGLFPPTERTENGYRLYDEAAASKLMEILLYREVGFSLEDIAKLFSASAEEWNRMLDCQIEKLRQEREQLTDRIAMIRRMRESGPEAVKEYFKKIETEEEKVCIVQTAEQN